jgi:hypothetical protein
MTLLRFSWVSFAIGIFNTGVVAASQTPWEARIPSSKVKRIIPSTHVRHEWHSSNPGPIWDLQTRADMDSTLPMRIALQQSNIEPAYDLLMNM